VVERSLETPPETDGPSVADPVSGIGEERRGARGRAATTEIIRAAEQAADRVAGILQDAEEAAERRLAAAREEAAAIHKQAQLDAEARAQQATRDAERVRAEADEYMANVRLAADSYASQREMGDLAAAGEQPEEAADGTRPVPVSDEQLGATAEAPGRVRRGIELTAVVAVMSRDISVFFRSWRSTTFSAIVEPIIFLLAFGLGFGALISEVRGHDYIQFVATGVVATTVVFSSAFPGMFQTFVKREFQRIYDALLATPVNVDELVTAEVLWISIRTGVYSIAPVVVAVGFGLRPEWTVVFVPFIAFLAALGLASFGVTMAAMMKSIANFNYVISGVLTPLILLAGAYFPVDSLPRWAFIADQFNPLYHCVALVRDAVFGVDTGHDLYHLAVMVLVGVVMWRIAIRQLRPRLID
jgi:lipooligosaccharide transport system permease protein